MSRSHQDAKSAAELFGLLWGFLADMLGTAATATLLRILKLDGHRVEAAGDGPEGVELALATAPEVAFIDIGLPSIDGYEVGRRIRAKLGSRVLLIALTAHGLEEDRRRSTEAGFDAHLVKPVSYEDLTRILGRGRRGD